MGLPGAYLQLWDPISAAVGEEGVHAVALEPGRDPRAVRGPRASWSLPRLPWDSVCAHVYMCLCVRVQASG